MEKEEWKCFIQAPGELCVTIIGVYWTHLLYVANSDIAQQYLLHIRLRTVREEAWYGWTTLIAWGAKVQLPSVRILDGQYTTAIIRKMRQWSVQVLSFQFISNYISEELPHARRVQRSSMVQKSGKLSMGEIRFREREREKRERPKGKLRTGPEASSRAPPK